MLGTNNMNRFVLSKSYITTCALADNEVSSKDYSNNMGSPNYSCLSTICLCILSLSSGRPILEWFNFRSSAGLQWPKRTRYVGILTFSWDLFISFAESLTYIYEIYYYCTGISNLLLHPGASGGFEGMTQLLQLCTDPSRRGQKLLDALSSFSTANIDINPKSKCYAFDGMSTVRIL